MVKTVIAVRWVGWEEGFEGGRRGVARGKKRRKRKSLVGELVSIYARFSRLSIREGCKQTHMIVKQVHCTPTCATPNRPAAQAKPLISLQHAKSSLLAGSKSTLAKAHAPDVAPSKTK